MRISDWSSDVCSSDLRLDVEILVEWDRCGHAHAPVRTGAASWPNREPAATLRRGIAAIDRKSVVEGKSVSVSVDLGGRRIIKKKKRAHNINTSRTSTQE